jgi:hypothetical protein
MSSHPTSARATLVAALFSSLAAVTCGARSDLTLSGGSSGGSGAGTGGSEAGTGGTAGRGGALGSGGGAGSGGTLGASGAGSGGCPSSLDSNPKHCGRCDHDCEGGECRNGNCGPVVIAELGNDWASALALDESNVYWARPIMRAPKVGGTAEVLSRDTPDAVWGIAVDTSSVFWGSPTYGPVRSITKLNLVARALTSDELGAARIAVDTTGVYFTSRGVYRASHDGSALVRLAPEGDTGIALDSDFVYFTSRTEGRVYRMTKDGQGLTRLATATLANEVAVHGEFVVFTAHGDGLVRRVPRDGGPSIVIGSTSGGNGVAVDHHGVYFTNTDVESIGYVPIEGYPDRSSLLVATGQHRPRAIAVDEKRIFWTNDAPKSAVMKIVKSSTITDPQ